MSQLRVGIVGTGSIARNRHLPSFQKHGKVALVAASDAVQASVEQTAAQFGIPAAYTDYHEMFEREKLDAVSICTPNKFHAPIAIEALRRGIHVLCEKPMALNGAESREMARVARETGKVLAIAYRYRFQPPSQAAKRVVEAGELGDVYMIRLSALRRRMIPSWGNFTNKELQGGGALIDFGVHLLDLALWLAGNPTAVEVSGVTSQRIGTRPDVNQWGPWNHESFGVEDHAAAFVRFEDGKALQLEVSWALNVAESGEKLSISGTEGGLDVYPFKVNKAAHGLLMHWEPDWLPLENVSDWDLQTADFVGAILEGRQPLVKPEQALQVGEIVDAIYQSAATGAAVTMEALRQHDEPDYNEVGASA